MDEARCRIAHLRAVDQRAIPIEDSDSAVHDRLLTR